MSKYLFCYFIGNSPEEERIHFAVSDDGLNFKPVNKNREVITPTLGKKCVRDPFIVPFRNGSYYIIGTDMKSEEGWVSNHALISWKSKDLVNWTDETVINIRDFGGEFKDTTRAWAPEALWDEESGKYFVYWSNSTKQNDNSAIYYAYTDDFKTLTEPKLLFERPGMQTIDADIIFSPIDNLYYMYFKYEESQKIAYVTSEKLSGPYTKSPTVVSLAPTGVEGSNIYHLDGTDRYIMIMDEYGAHRYFAQETKNMRDFTALSKGSYSMDFSPRHGNIIGISDEHYQNLISKYGF